MHRTLLLVALILADAPPTAWNASPNYTASNRETSGDIHFVSSSVLRGSILVMRLVVQRVTRASVSVDGAPVASIGRGLLLFLGVETGDADRELEAVARKVAGLRIFEDDAGRMNRSCEDLGGEFLVVSQFTLCADLSKGRRPGFEAAMKPPESERLYERFCARLRELSGRPVRQGRFGATMAVELVNDGPATFLWREESGTQGR